VADHPLGYRKYYLLKTRWLSVRIHIWWRNRQDASEDPHDHRWSFVAVPLWGRFTEVRWERSRIGQVRIRSTASPDRGEGRDYREIGVDRLARLGERTRRQWIPYRCRLGQIHTYQPAGKGPHVSLVFMGPTRTATSDVWERHGS
jgi:hypothetical protein